MKSYSVNFIPSFDSLPYLNKDSHLPENEMMFLMSRRDFQSHKSIENLGGEKFSIQHLKAADQVSIKCTSEDLEEKNKKQQVLKTEDSFKSPTVKRKGGCVCKKTGCLKLYCECFRKGKICGQECSCCNCNNVEQNKQLIQDTRISKKKRSKTMVGKIYCTCKKTECQKKYCECFNAGITCNEQCRCNGCSNKEHHHQ